jgi:DNA primase
VGDIARRSVIEILDEEIMPRLGVDDVYGGVQFRTRQGRYWRGSCPLHEGHDPNFSVDTQTLSWSCFSRCGHGSALTYLNGGEVPRGARFVELVRELGDRVGVMIGTLSPAELERLEVERRRRQLLNDYAALSGAMLAEPAGAHVARYLTARALPAEPAQLAQLGLGVHPGPVRMERDLRATRTELAAVGLLDSRWAGRLVVAWRGRWGRVATIAARAVRDDDTAAKYLYLAGAALPALFGVDALSAGSSRSREPVILVEGLLDALSLRAHGFGRALALGRSLPSPRHFAELGLLGITSVVLALDTDPAGEAGSRRFLDLARELAPDLLVRVVPPDAFAGSKDPAEILATRGPEAMSEAIAARVPPASYLAGLALRDVGPYDRLAVRRDALHALECLVAGLVGPERDADVEDIVALAVPRLGYSEAAIRTALRAPERPVLESRVVADEHTGGFENLSRIASEVAQAVGESRTPALVTHILRGSGGPRTRAIVALTGPPHVGALGDFSFEQLHKAILEVWPDTEQAALGTPMPVDSTATKVAAKPAKVAYRPVNQGKAWSIAHEAELKEQWIAGATVKEVALSLGRTISGVAARLVRLGLVGSRDEARRRRRRRV